MVMYIRAKSVKGKTRETSWNAAEMPWRRGNLQRWSSNGIPWQPSLRDVAVIREERRRAGLRAGLYLADAADPLRVLSSLWGLSIERVSQIGGPSPQV